MLACCVRVILGTLPLSFIITTKGTQVGFTIIPRQSLTGGRGNFQDNSIPFNNSTHPWVNSQINTPEVTMFKLAFTVEYFWSISLTFISLTVEPSLTLVYTFVSCLSYCKFQPSTLSASRRKCSKSPAFAARTSPSCIESTSQSLPTSAYLSSTAV